MHEYMAFGGISSWTKVNGFTLKVWVTVFTHIIACGCVVIERKSNAVTSVRYGQSQGIPLEISLSRRQKRSIFTSAEELAILNKHNELRRLEGASNMELLIWNDYLKQMAEGWAVLCRWEHGQPNRDPNEVPFKQIGQNLYVTNGSFDALYGLQLFYDEKKYYDYETGGCSKPPCGHYTQLVWAKSQEVGCAFASCPQMMNIDITNAKYLVCNYGPTGNYVGVKPFKKGPECVECGTGQFWCDNGLCRRDCTIQNTKCNCKAACQNCGTTIRNNCSCACANGWHGSDCSLPCRDTSMHCGANPGWPISWCDKQDIMTNCPAMCSLCKVAYIPVTCATTPIPEINRAGNLLCSIYVLIIAWFLSNILS